MRGFAATLWLTMLAPAKTPRARLTAQGVEPVGSTPEELAAILKADAARFAQIVQQAKIRIE